jgi:hypothetical protein
MHPVRIRAKKKRAVLILVLALGLGLPPPAQAYLLDVTVSSINLPAPESGHPFFYLAGYNSTNNKNQGLPAYLDMHRQVDNGDFDPGVAAGFASGPGIFASPKGPSGNILNRIAPFSSTLLLLGSGLMGLVMLRFRRRRG